ncbi:MAG TPA: helix-turn-helix domain-containing protein [Pyrinomonadaceae bacterium]|nr:helix-turn-helix domain-containing protein [Pyrinomonadaceae bacterium]
MGKLRLAGRLDERAAGARPAASDSDEAYLNLSRALQNALEAIGRLQSDERGRPPALPEMLDGIDFYEEVKRYEIALIKKALRLTRGHQRRAASLLKLRPTTLNMKLKLYKIDGGDSL